MKEKNKKILKGLGIGALACVGMLGLTGCANVEVSQDKVNSMIETAEKADARLDEYIDLLEQQNQQLLEQNNKLEDLINQDRLTKEEVWNLAMTTDFNLMMNVGGARDNLVITAVNDNLQLGMLYYYNSSDSKIFAEISGDGQGVVAGAELWYQKGDSNVVLADIDKAGTGYMCDYTDEKSENDVFEDCIGVYRGSCPGIRDWELTIEDLNHYEILENGNVALTFVKYNTYGNNKEYYTTLNKYMFEYALEGKLVSIEYGSRCVEATDGAEVIDTNEDVKYVFSYGTVDTELVESWVELAEEYRNEQ